MIGNRVRSILTAIAPSFERRGALMTRLDDEQYVKDLFTDARTRYASMVRHFVEDDAAELGPALGAPDRDIRRHPDPRQVLGHQ